MTTTRRNVCRQVDKIAQLLGPMVQLIELWSMLRGLQHFEMENAITEEEVKLFLEKLMQVDTLRKQRYIDWKNALFPSPPTS